jgi:hypothetical protein
VTSHDERLRQTTSLFGPTSAPQRLVLVHEYLQPSPQLMPQATVLLQLALQAASQATLHSSMSLQWKLQASSQIPPQRLRLLHDSLQPVPSHDR